MSVSESLDFRRRSATPLRFDAGPTSFALAALVVGTGFLAYAVSARQAALYLVGAGAGLILYHAAFGFTSSWRVFISDRRGAGLRAQMAMLALTVLVFFPVLAAGSLFGQPVSGSVSPVGTSVVVGAFLFGLGMQLGGGCASGTLYTVGGGSTRMIATLFFFIVGSVLGAAHLPWWSSLPSFAPVSIIRLWGPWPALAASFAVFGAIALLTVVLERRRHGSLQTANETPKRGLARFVQGPWPLIGGAVGLALVNILTLALAGKPWGITSAFALWGSKALAGLGVNVASWGFWSSPASAASLQAPVYTDVNSVMDIGIIVGALLAAAIAGRYAPQWRIPLKTFLAAAVGGVLLGYGSRLAYGCNIGAYFSGIASGSLHGWLWLVAAFVGNIVGTRFRPLFGLEVERTPRLTAC